MAMRRSLFLLILMMAPFANASWGDTFSFNLEKGDTPGCIKISYVTTSSEFPNLDNGVVTDVRFFYSKKSKGDVTENSPYQDTQPFEDENGSAAVSPNEFCGFAPGRYFFKYGLYDTDNQLLEFMTDDQWSSYSNSVEVEDAP